MEKGETTKTPVTPYGSGAGKKAEVDKTVNDAKNSATNGQKAGGTKKLEEEGKKLLKGLFGG